MELIDETLADGAQKPEAVLADCDYGDTGAFCRGLEQRGLSYAVGITSDVVVWTEPPFYSVPDKPSAPGSQPKLVCHGGQRPLANRIVAEHDQRRYRALTWREGSQGPMRSRWLACRVQTAWRWQFGQEPGNPLWLLIEWPKEEAEPPKYYLCDLPEALGLKRLVQIVRGRWRV